tara:strand:+ start:649 stop:1155 length:507 start_codon:yes stop_codon:yes gene_type:complete
MDFGIDVSGGDILTKDYVICIASKNITKGFKFTSELIKILRSRHGEGKYRYLHSRHGKSLLKIRIYCTIIYYLFKDLNLKNKELNLKICRDFHGHEREITSNLKYFLEDKLGLKINTSYLRLTKGDSADKYANLMRKDKKNELSYYVKISLEEIEKFLKCIRGPQTRP